MKPKWLIEDFEADNKFDVLAEEVKRQGMEAEIIRYMPFESGTYNKYGKDECVIVQSSLNLARQLMKEKGWIPGPWLNSKAYECTAFYPYLGKYLLNKDFIMLPRGSVNDKWSDIINTFCGPDDDDAVFIRPSSGIKTFTGKVFQTKHLKEDWEWVEEFTEPEDMVIIASVKEIEKEWRFVCADHSIITGSLYKQRIGGAVSSGKYREIPMAPHDNGDRDDLEAHQLAIAIASEGYKCDPMYTIDICKTANERFHLLEIGSYSCAGLYDCNPKIMVKEAARLAMQEWREFYEVIQE